MIGFDEFSFGIWPVFRAKLSMSFRGRKNKCQYKSTLSHNESVDFSTFDPKGYESTWESSKKNEFNNQNMFQKVPKFKKTKMHT